MSKKVIKAAVGYALANFPTARETAKKWNELLFWRLHFAKTKGVVYNQHFLRLFTSTFQLDPGYYDGKRILDVGCGPLGTLDWADNALERVGVDPLADKYTALIASKPKMTFVACDAEDMPFESSSFDVVSSFNSLDHVRDVQSVVKEIVRVLKPGGDFLLIVEVNHPPSITEPHNISPDFLDGVAELKPLWSRVFRSREDHDIYASIFEQEPPPAEGEPGIMVARLQKA